MQQHVANSRLEAVSLTNLDRMIGTRNCFSVATEAA